MDSDMYGVVIAVSGSVCEITIEQVEGPWRRKGEEFYEKSVEAEHGRAIHGFEPKANGKTGQQWVYAPVRAAKEAGESDEVIKKAREEFSRLRWGVGQEVKFKRRDGGGPFSACSVGKWCGRTTFYSDDQYVFEGAVIEEAKNEGRRTKALESSWI